MSKRESAAVVAHCGGPGVTRKKRMTYIPTLGLIESYTVEWGLADKPAVWITKLIAQCCRNLRQKRPHVTRQNTERWVWGIDYESAIS